MKKILAIAILAAVPAFSAAAGGSAVVRAQGLYGNFMKAYSSGDRANCVKYGNDLVKAIDHPDPLYKLSQCLSENDQPDESLKILNRLGDLGLSYKISENPRLQKLKEAKGYPALAAKFEKNLRQVNHSVDAFTLSDSRLIPEGIASLPDGSKFYVGSGAKQKIIEYAAGSGGSGRERDFIESGQDGIWFVVGMKVSPDRRELWAGSFSESGETNGYAGIFAFDLASGKLVAKYVADNKSGHHLFNDLVFADGGKRIYFTDSKAGKVLSLDRATGRIESNFQREFIYPNGIALDEKRDALFVADFGGVTRIDLRSGRIDKVSAGNLTFLQSIDGLYFYEGSLVAVQNPGEGADRIARFYLDETQTKVTSVKILQSDHPDFNIPTTGTITGDDFYYIANSYVSSLKPDGTIADAGKLKRPIIKKINLKAASR